MNIDNRNLGREGIGIRRLVPPPLSISSPLFIAGASTFLPFSPAGVSAPLPVDVLSEFNEIADYVT